MKDRYFANYFRGFLTDYRIEKRAEKIMEDMLKYGNVVVNKFCGTLPEKKAAYNLFNNSSFSEMNLIDALTNKCKNNQAAPHLLCINDTTEINFSKHIDRIGKEDKDIGPVTCNDNAGYFCHPMLVVDPEQQLPIGFSSVQVWNRSWDKKNKHERAYYLQNIEDKESYRWLKAPQETQELLRETPLLTIIGDREADIYEEFSIIPDDRTHLLIRSSINRRLYGQDLKLFEHLEARPIELRYELPVRNNKKRKTRTAQMTLKFDKVKICRPEKTRLAEYPEYIEMWAIEAREMPNSVPQGEDPIIWRLLTTHTINDVKDALQCIEWYSQRWLIEELFRVLKSKGLQIESSQLATGSGLKKQLIMALQVALTTMALKMAYDKNHEIKASVIFSPEELSFIQVLNNTLEGNTQKLKNPFSKDTLAYCSWVMARLSGWSGYISQPKPGYIAMKNGIDIFRLKYEGYLLAMSLLNNKACKE